MCYSKAPHWRPGKRWRIILIWILNSKAFTIHNNKTFFEISKKHWWKWIIWNCTIMKKTRNSCSTQYLIKNLRIQNLLYFLLCNSPASEFYMPKFRNTLSVPSSQAGRYEEWLHCLWAIFKPNIFPYKYPNILKPSLSSYLPAYEDGT